jgi:hypothetical protein
MRISAESTAAPVILGEPDALPAASSDLEVLEPEVPVVPAGRVDSFAQGDLVMGVLGVHLAARSPNGPALVPAAGAMRLPGAR